ncbi:MAG: class I SAM-dependent methyltransferase [Bdellovibrionaceae bacterium]|nr:class I SAM-dependent methyltransferase [Pseudobdellovibrionaceae bacterium]
MSLAYADHQEKISEIYDAPDYLLLRPKQKLLEYGCGVGALSRQVALKSPDTQIIAMDINKELIEIGKNRAQEQGIGNITFQLGDACASQTLDSTYDGAYCRFLFEEFTEPVKVIRSMSSLVQPGGWISTYERLNNYCRLYPHSEAINQSWQAIYEFYKNTYGARPYAAEELQDHFSKAGLKDIKSQGFSKILSMQKDKEQFIWFIEAALSVIGQMEAELLKHELITELILKQAKEDYQQLLDSPNAFALEVTVCVTGIK